MAHENNRRQPNGPRDDEILAEMREQTRVWKGILRLLDEFARAYLDARFPNGKPFDQWRRRD